jgi:CRP-like cAMP-binding protein
MPEPIQINGIMARALSEQLGLASFYPDLDADKLKALFPKSGLYYFQENEPVIRQGTASRNLYVLMSGRLRVTQDRPEGAVELAVLEAINMVGEIALLKPDAIRTANVIAVTTAQLYCLVRDDVQRVMEATPDLGKHLVQLARDRIEKTKKGG